MPDVAESIRRLNAATARASAARTALAAASKVGKPPRVTHPAYAALLANRKRLLAEPDVLGVGLGVRWRGGAPTDEPVVSVFVREKVPLDQLDESMVFASAVRVGNRSIGVDVVAFGDLARPDPTRAPPERVELDAMATGEATWTPGSSINQVTPPRFGTIGSFAHGGGKAFALTAMHVFTVQELDTSTGDKPIRAAANGRQVGVVDLGTMTGVDAARVLLDDDVQPTTHVPSVGEIAGWRWPAFPADIGAGVTLAGARSGRLQGAITHLHVDFPTFSLVDTIIASVPTQDGDSGGALLDAKPYVLGFLVGWSNKLDASLRIFSSAGHVLGRLHCNIP